MLKPFGALSTLLISAALPAQQVGPWTRVATTGPSAREEHAMVYDSARAVTVLFGGYGSAFSLQDTWEWDGTSWTMMATAGPGQRYGHAMAYDSARAVTVMFGSFSQDDTWEWDGTSWTQVATTGPGARVDHAMAYDSARGVTVLFGGGNLGSVTFGDTWEWDGTSWTQVATTGPSARENHAMAYDSARSVTVMKAGNAGSTYFGDTWEWDGTSWTLVDNTPGWLQGHTMTYDSKWGVTLRHSGQYFTPSRYTEKWDGTSWTPVASEGPSARRNTAMAYDSARGMTVLFGGDGPVLNRDTWILTCAECPATASSFGTGCGNPALSLAPVAAAPPSIGGTAQAEVANLSSSFAFVVFGWSNTTFGTGPLPLPLDTFGMPGCSLLQSSESGSLPVTFTSATTATFSQPLPNLNILIGGQLFLQAWSFAPGANAADIVVSNGVRWEIGV
jgi:hypothetical protein